MIVVAVEAAVRKECRAKGRPRRRRQLRTASDMLSSPVLPREFRGGGQLWIQYVSEAPAACAGGLFSPAAQDKAMHIRVYLCRQSPESELVRKTANTHTRDRHYHHQLALVCTNLLLVLGCSFGPFSPPLSVPLVTLLLGFVVVFLSIAHLLLRLLRLFVGFLLL